MRGGAPGPDLRLEARLLRGERLGARDGRPVVRQVRVVEVEALRVRGVARRVEDVRRRAVVVGRPLLEVVRDVERGRVRRRVLEVEVREAALDTITLLILMLVGS